MRGIDTSVNDVGAGTCTGTVVVVVGTTSALAVRNASQAPWRSWLLDVSIDSDGGVLFNVINLCIALERGSTPRMYTMGVLHQGDGEAAQRL